MYFCKPAKELDSKLEDLGAKKLQPLGLGITGSYQKFAAVR